MKFTFIWLRTFYLTLLRVIDYREMAATKIYMNIDSKKTTAKALSFEGHDKAQQRSKELLTNLRKITQAIDLHSKFLQKNNGVTSPQLIILLELKYRGTLSISELAELVSLSQGTVTEIVLRLEKKALVCKSRSQIDKRKSIVALTDQGKAVIKAAPSPLQETFIQSFHELAEWEQLMLLSAISRIVSLMSAQTIDASPFLASGPLESDMGS